MKIVICDFNERQMINRKETEEAKAGICKREKFVFSFEDENETKKLRREINPNFTPIFFFSLAHSHTLCFTLSLSFSLSLTHFFFWEKLSTSP